MKITTNAPFPNRIQWVLDSYVGPFVQNGPFGTFDPRSDLEVYVDGIRIPVSSFVFDAVNNRYLLYMNQNINLQGVIQVIHHMPDPPFATMSSPVNVVPGFALIGTYLPAGDGTLPPAASAAATPTNMFAYTPIYVIWDIMNIAQVQITGSNGIDPPIDSGLITTSGTNSGLYEITGGLQANMTLVFTAYDTPGHVAVLPDNPISLPVTVTFVPIEISEGFGQTFGQEFSS